MKNFLLICLLFVAGCNSADQNKNDAKEKNDTTVNAKDTAAPVLVSGCYAWKFNKDSASLQLDVSGDTVTGNLKYYLYEKDSNSGTFKGIIKDNMVDANYTFQSEGMTSVREVVFKIQNETLVEGYGDIIMKGDTAKFKNISQLQFQNDRPFVKEMCR